MDCVDCDAAIVALSRRLLSLSAPVRPWPLHKAQMSLPC